ncbi:MAG: bifunctional 2-polyprenyl-6-hydroxyphenol methylase/3-demethylubiquinol 3-O-methyltransferase UbiG [Coxiellaceae bacterium]|nr:bifunctional 2-polyprenyl-6-hydroxyphenol methylase/3-demethylubiquinol 3-O-methyltransferase UbiG [Coxiellaceae bacterium]
MNDTANNVNPDEIAKFSAMADQWWDPKGPMKPLHALNPLRLAYIQKHAEISGKHVLDIGCGGGILTESLAVAGAIATGIDMSTDAIMAAKNHGEKNNVSVTYYQIRTEDFAKDNQHTFDVITCMEMLEHVPDPLSIIVAAKKMLKPDGKIFFSTINRTVKAFFEAIVGAEYVLNLLPKGTHHYDTFIRPSELNLWAEETGLLLKDIQGITYSPFKKVFTLTNKVDVNYLMCFTG